MDLVRLVLCITDEFRDAGRATELVGFTFVSSIDEDFSGKKGSALSLVLTGDLARAVRQEAVPATKHWWDVGTSAVWKWRRALGVVDTEGNRLKTPERVAAFVKATAPTARSPERRAKIVAAKKG
ncbi:hypothetical protein [Anatilimnocola aggregata]|uniref:hypothetical protein n=1 Tax=Anatilimnocola aggregata TaxID=2528021 RepID=UPI0011A85AF7|nr:hypothetical protein [Anatilimnocola aggregata]